DPFAVRPGVIARYSSQARRSAQMTSIVELTIQTPGQVRFSITRKKWSLTGAVISGISRLQQLNLPMAKSSLWVTNRAGRNNGQKRTAGEEKIERLLVISGIDRISLSFPVKVAILQEGTGLTQEEEL